MARAQVDSAMRRRLKFVLALVAVLIVAAYLRLDGLQTVPPVTDESAEVLYAFDIAFNGERPLVHTDSYNGPLWPYLLAGTFRLFGSSADLPRQFALALGLAAVAATFILGWVVAPRRKLAAATLAGLVQAVAFNHVLVGSRVAWSNSSTPLWTTLTVLALLAAMRMGGARGDGGEVRPRTLGTFALAGVLAGLALQSHPSVLVFNAALGIWVARRWSLRRPEPWAALVAALAAYSPVLVYNAFTDLDTLAQAGESRNVVEGFSLTGWLGHVANLTTQLGRGLAGYATPFDVLPVGEPWAWGFTHGLPLVYAGLAWLVVVLAARRGLTLPAMALVVGSLGLPLVNQEWSGFYEARYLGFLTPLIGAAAGFLVAGPFRLRDAEEARADAAAGTRAKDRAIGWSIGWARDGAILVALLVPAISSMVLVASVRRSGPGETRALRAATRLPQATQSEAPMILVQKGLDDVDWALGGHPRRAIEYYLTLRRTPHDVAEDLEINHHLAEGRQVLAFLTPAAADWMDDSHALERLHGTATWGLYGAGPR